MLFLTDENVSPRVVRALRATGHDVWDVKEHEWQGTSDEEIFRHASKERRVIISEDQDFRNLQRFPPKEHPGAMLIHFERMHPNEVRDRLMLFLKTVKTPAELENRVVILEETAVHVIQLKKD